MQKTNLLIFLFVLSFTSQLYNQNDTLRLDTQIVKIFVEKDHLKNSMVGFDNNDSQCTSITKIINIFDSDVNNTTSLISKIFNKRDSAQIKDSWLTIRSFVGWTEDQPQRDTNLCNTLESITSDYLDDLTLSLFFQDLDNSLSYMKNKINLMIAESHHEIIEAQGIKIQTSTKKNLEKTAKILEKYEKIEEDVQIANNKLIELKEIQETHFSYLRKKLTAKSHIGSTGFIYDAHDGVAGFQLSIGPMHKSIIDSEYTSVSSPSNKVNWQMSIHYLSGNGTRDLSLYPSLRYFVFEKLWFFGGPGIPIIDTTQFSFLLGLNALVAESVGLDIRVNVGDQTHFGLGVFYLFK